MSPGAFGDFLSGIFVTNREAILQNITLVDRVFFEHRLWQINPTSRSILGDVTQYVGQLERLAKVAEQAKSLGLGVNAGHGLNYENTRGIFAVPHLNELNIGHSIVSRAVTVGLGQAVREILELMDGYPQAE